MFTDLILLPDILTKDPSDFDRWMRSNISSSFSPEMALMIAVLEEAISDLSDPKETKKTRQWFFRSNGGYLYSFPTICEFLDLDMETVRKWALGEQKKRIARHYLRRPRIAWNI